MRNRLFSVFLVLAIFTVTVKPLSRPKSAVHGKARTFAGEALAAPAPSPLAIRQEKYRFRGNRYTVWTFPYSSQFVPVARRSRCKARVPSNFLDGKRLPGPYYDPATGEPVDYYRVGGREIKGRQIGRSFIWVKETNQWGISIDYRRFRHDPDVVRMYACAERLCPLQFDRHDTDISPSESGKTLRRKKTWRRIVQTRRQAFARRPTSRCALGFTAKSVKGETQILVRVIRTNSASLYELDRFMSHKLACYAGLNLDGGSSCAASHTLIDFCPSGSPQYARIATNPGR